DFEEKMKIISIFNNKGGVGKTTYMYHIAHILAKREKTVLVVDLDSQCNLSAYSLSDSELERSWRPDRGNSIWNAIERVYEGLGDIRQRKPSQLSECYPNLYIVPGDVLLSNYEDALGNSWSSAMGGNAPALRIQSAIYRYIKWAAEQINADVVMLDLGPNLGALNRAVLAASDYFIAPMSPDLFSIRGTKNLGPN
ncbi:ParA family protein, partial [Vibrio cholerae]|uniref:ParA family protein n=1 Tax=Vibrio cholerae TaxID=666 RepID=UPI001C676D5C